MKSFTSYWFAYISAPWYRTKKVCVLQTGLWISPFKWIMSQLSGMFVARKNMQKLWCIFLGSPFILKEDDWKNINYLKHHLVGTKNLSCLPNQSGAEKENPRGLENILIWSYGFYFCFSYYCMPEESRFKNLFETQSSTFFIF